MTTYTTADSIDSEEVALDLFLFAIGGVDAPPSVMPCEADAAALDAWLESIE